jgi:hypothetical protein
VRIIASIHPHRLPRVPPSPLTPPPHDTPAPHSSERRKLPPRLDPMANSNLPRRIIKVSFRSDHPSTDLSTPSIRLVFSFSVSNFLGFPCGWIYAGDAETSQRARCGCFSICGFGWILARCCISGFDFRSLNGLFVQHRGSALPPRRRTCGTSTS